MEKKNKIIYWIFTVLFTLPFFGSAIVFLSGAKQAVEGFAHLGYPLYLLKFLGVAKLLGIVAVTTGKYPKIKEWAYAGFTFDLLGAFYSHVSSGDQPHEVAGPVVVLAFMTISYVYWKKQGPNSASPAYSAMPDRAN